MIQVLQTHFPQGTRWHRPDSGMFLWVEMLEEINMDEVLMTALAQEKVAFLPGSAFQVNANHQAAHGMRLNFSNCSVERIEDGIACIARILS